MPKKVFLFHRILSADTTAAKKTFLLLPRCDFLGLSKRTAALSMNLDRPTLHMPEKFYGLIYHENFDQENSWVFLLAKNTQAQSVVELLFGQRRGNNFFL